MAGQNHHFVQYAPEPLPYVIQRSVKETLWLCGVLNKQLAEGHNFIAGDYSIVDMACDPWIVPHERQRHTLTNFPHLMSWFDRVRDRSATMRAHQRAN